MARIPEGSRVLPAICTEERITLGAQLVTGAVIRGQNEISPPSVTGQAAELGTGGSHGGSLACLVACSELADRCNRQGGVGGVAALSDWPL